MIKTCETPTKRPREHTDRSGHYQWCLLLSMHEPSLAESYLLRQYPLSARHGQSIKYTDRNRGVTFTSYIRLWKFNPYIRGKTYIVC